MSHQRRRGHLKIYLGYAAGVGKTYRMLEDAHELKARGIDVVLAFLEPQGRNDLMERAKEFDTVPLLRVACRGSYTEEMDVTGILSRRPKVCLVDDLAHTNAPGSERQRRWQDIQVLLDGGVDVLTTMNVQDLASLSDQIWQITGLRVRETVPDWVFQEADEVVMVDVTPRALIHRLERGVIYPPERAKAESGRLFQEPTLVALRELAIRQTAQALEARATAKKEQAELRAEKILVSVAADPSTAMLLRRARRMADYLHVACVASLCLAKRTFLLCRCKNARRSNATFVSPRVYTLIRPSCTAKTAQARWWNTRTRMESRRSSSGPPSNLRGDGSAGWTSRTSCSIGRAIWK